MLRQPEQLGGVSAVREGIKAVSRMALLKCGGIDGEAWTCLDGETQGYGYTMVAVRGGQRLGVLGKPTEAAE